ncbi:MAG: hypothetical protein ACP5HD_10390 [Thermoproteus sp.]
MPAAGLAVRVRGSRRGIAAVSIPNVAGANNVGRINEPVPGGFKARNARAREHDPQNGELSLLAKDPVAVIPQFNLDVPRSEAPKVCALGPEDERPWLYLMDKADSGLA